MDRARTILITRELDDGQTAFARRLGLTPLSRPAIRASFPEPGEKLLTLSDRHAGAPWVFTSKNGVKGFFGLESGPEPVAGLIRNLKENHPVVYAVGNKTAEALHDIGLAARVPDEQNAVGLAELIISDLQGEGTGSGPDSSASQAGDGPDSSVSQAGGVPDSSNPRADRGAANKSIIHWCGNRSREELGILLEKAGIRLVQQVVYHTSLNEFTLPETAVDAILFFSPSAVEAFRHSVGFNRELPELFAIGTTTAEALSIESGANVHVPTEPSTEHLLELTAGVLNSLNNS